MNALEAIFKYKQPDRGSVVPTFFIGLGGAGGAMVERIMEKIRTRWDEEKFRGLYHGFAFDTDASALEEYRAIPARNRVLLSDFSKRHYVSGKRGDSYVPADSHVMQWAHDWYRFRTDVGAGAGQIRLESRLCLHYQLERDRGGILDVLGDALRDATSHDNPFRRATPPQMNVFVFASVAGGTGSGSLLSVAYLMQRLIRDKHHQPRTYACVMLPGPFFNEVPHCQRVDIDANGYAALKEIEHVMRLGIEGPGGIGALPFHYSGFHRDDTHVDRAPFNFVYLLDEPDQISAKDYREFRDAVADAMFVQFFSPVSGVQSSGWDNMVKRVRGGSNDGYVLNYGTYGCSVLILPDDDLLEYCARRYALDAMDRFLLQRRPAQDGTDAASRAEDRFAVDTESEDWALMSPEEQGKSLDRAFVAFVDFMAEEEDERHKGESKGVFQGVRAQLSATTGAALSDTFDELVEELLQDCYASIDLTRLHPQAVNPANKDVAGHLERLREQVEDATAALNAAVQHRLARVEDGTTLRELFNTHRVGPLGQRYFLISLIDRLREREATLRAELGEQRGLIALDSDGVRASAANWQQSLDKTAPKTLWERIRGENADFNADKSRYVDWFNRSLRDAWADHLRKRAEREVVSAFTRRGQSLLQTFRDLAGRATALRRRLDTELGHILRMGGLTASRTESNLYAFDLEVLRDEASGRRLWDHYYARTFGNDWSLFQPDEILPVVNASFDPIVERGGTTREPTIEEIAERILGGLVGLGQRRLRPAIKGDEALSDAREQLGLLLDDALKIEAEIVRGEFVEGPLDQEAIDEYIADKLAHARRKASLLCGVLPPADDPSIEPDDFLLACVHPVYGGGSGLASRMREELGCKLNLSWDDPKSSLLYRAKLGFPLFWVEKLNSRMKAAYHEIQQTKVANRSYPLHIDKNWEHDLPDLDPEVREAEAEARAAEEQHVRWAFCRIAGTITPEDGGGWRFTLGDLDRQLGPSFPKALEAFGELPELVRARLAAATKDVRGFLESPHETGDAWNDLGAYVREVSDRCMTLPEGNLMHAHLSALSHYLRAHAPQDALAAVSQYLAPDGA